MKGFLLVIVGKKEVVGSYEKSTCMCVFVRRTRFELVLFAVLIARLRTLTESCGISFLPQHRQINIKPKDNSFPLRLFAAV
jgi:hypothetical protein